MKRIPADAQAALTDFEAALTKLWDIVLGRAEHPDFSRGQMFHLAMGLLDAIPQGFGRALFRASLKRTYEHGDRLALATESLKAIYYAAGSDSVDETLRNADKRKAFGQQRAMVSEDTLATAWNRPGFDGKSNRERAAILEREGLGRRESVERRARRMADRGIEMGGKARRSSSRRKGNKP